MQVGCKKVPDHKRNKGDSMIRNSSDGPARRGGRRALAVLAALGITAALAACGSDDGGSSSDSTESDASEPASTDAAEETTADTAAPDDSAATDDTAAPADSGGDSGDSAAGSSDIRVLTGFDAESEACSDAEIDLGAVLALTGPGSFYGTTMTRGIDLAVAQIDAAGGPTFNVIYKDHKSGDPAAGQQAITELGESGVPAKLASYVDDLGAMLAGTAEYEVFTLDGGGGTSEFGKAQPFFWGTRAITPNDPLPGLFAYLQETNPDATTVGLVGWDVGDPSNDIIKEDILAKIADAGYEHNGLYELTPVGSQDYSQVLPKITANEPDILIAPMYGQDIGSFINQAETAGIEAQIIGFEFTPDGINASKGTFEDGYTFAYDFFDPANPTNPLAEYFVSEFEAEYGEAPDFYAANYYEDTLSMWDLVRRVCAAGEEITGATLDAAMQENPTLISVYGGDDSGAGSKTMDLESHSVTQRTMGVFRYENGEVTPLAYFDLDAADYQMAE
jgi:ABC-type branched-subunit amino acid transport system substrate-binding protein